MALENYPEPDEDASVDQSLEMGHPEEANDFSEGSSAADASSRGQGWKALCQQLGNRSISEGTPGVALMSTMRSFSGPLFPKNIFLRIKFDVTHKVLRTLPGMQ